MESSIRQLRVSDGLLRTASEQQTGSGKWEEITTDLEGQGPQVGL